MALAMISVQRGGSVLALDRPPNESVVLGFPPLTAPGGLARLASGALAVADSAGGSIAVEGPGGWGTYGSLGGGAGRFRNPTAMTIDGDFTYVADTGNHRIVRLQGLSATGIAGGGWASVGTRGGPVDFHLSSPGGVAVADGTVVVADTGNGRVVAFATDEFESAPPNGWNVIDLPAQVAPARPFGVARRSTGWAVSDIANARVHLLDEAFAVVDTIRTDRLRLGVPAYLAFDALDRLIIADPSANEVRLLTLGARQRTVWRCRGSNPRYPAPLFERIGGVCAATH